MNVLYLTHDLSSDSGWDHYSLNIVSRMASNKINPLVLTFQNATNSLGGVGTITLIPALPHYNELQSARNLLKAYLHLLTVARKADIVHCLVEPYVPLAFLLSLGKPLFITGVGTYLVHPFTNHNSLAWFYRIAYKRANEIMCISQFTREKLLEYVPNLENTCVVNLGVDKKYFKQADSPVEMPAGRVLLSVGSLKERKGYEYSIKGFARIAELFPDVTYVIIGRISNIKYKESLEQLTEELGLKQRVRLITDADEKELLSWYHKATLFVLTPVNAGVLFEGFGLVYLEASASGLAVVGSLDCGATDAVQDGKTGILVPQRDDVAIANALSQLLTNDELRKQMAYQGLLHACQQNWDSVIHEIITRYRRTV